MVQLQLQFPNIHTSLFYITLDFCKAQNAIRHKAHSYEKRKDSREEMMYGKCISDTHKEL